MADSDPAADFRWTGFFQRTGAALFVLNRRRQLLFVNRAWESLTGLAATEVYKLPCKRNREPQAGATEAVLGAMWPTREVLEGRRTTVRRLVPRPGGPAWCWDVEFLPLPGPQGSLGVLGIIHPVSAGAPTASQSLPEKLIDLRRRSAETWQQDRIHPHAPAMVRTLQQVRLASQTRMPALLTGEKGVGKEWLARTIHLAGPARERTFVALDCLHLPADALAWALFGPQALARRAGTLYLHEAARLPREIQARCVELFSPATEIDDETRLLAATSEPWDALCSSGQLVPEYHALLSTLTIHVPALRERAAELPGLVEQMLERISHGGDSAVKTLTDQAWDVLRAYNWPGNLDELYAVLSGACRRASAAQIDASDLPAFLRPPPAPPPRTWPLDAILEKVEKRLLQMALLAAKGNRSKAAELLEIWRPRLLRRLEALGIDE
jgi:DNA-binding NtrC family response regulator